MNLKARKNNRLKKKIASNYITDKNTAVILIKNINDIENFEYAVNLSCKLINRERLHQFQLISCDYYLLNSKFYKQALDVFMIYTNPDASRKIRCILCEPILINSEFYPIVLKLLSTNLDVDYTSNIINTILIDNIVSISPDLFKMTIYFKTSTINEICSILKNPLINKEKVLNILSKLITHDDVKIVEKQIEDIILLIRRIMFLEDKKAIKILLDFLYNQINIKNENNNEFMNNFQNKIIEQRHEIAKRKSLK